ncbi:hypothetical protein WH52_01340 [Tenacibaculum holothuriorum]|uniref:Uncharacterized protein n=1 Tax=Tenacibaculum holothuriorum TaxID=1635173 RepID=A0A1Y2PH35_9FLAO|nr:hypothetical protein [Tenacibaculum holothuriorum]OSY89311.1 hypothetical protein WH52_01340 [Tenacibaculum holothuriorum]
MSHLLENNQKESQRLDTLKEGQKFFKIDRLGLPTTTIYKFLGKLGGMAKATKVDCNSPYLLQGYQLVFPLSK